MLINMLQEKSPPPFPIYSHIKLFLKFFVLARHNNLNLSFMILSQKAPE